MIVITIYSSIKFSQISINKTHSHINKEYSFKGIFGYLYHHLLPILYLQVVMTISVYPVIERINNMILFALYPHSQMFFKPDP